MVEALVSITLASGGGFQEQAINAIRQIPGVEWVRPLYGAIDAVALVQANDLAALRAIVSQIRSVQGVDRTTTQIVA